MLEPSMAPASIFWPGPIALPTASSKWRMSSARRSRSDCWALFSMWGAANFTAGGFYMYCHSSFSTWREVGRNPDPDFNDTLTVCLAVDTMYSHAITNFLACSFFTIFNFAVSTLLFVRGLSAHTTKLTRPHLALTITRVRIASRGVS